MKYQRSLFILIALGAIATVSADEYIARVAETGAKCSEEDADGDSDDGSA